MWTVIADTRWQLDDTVRHLLLHADGVLVELHDQTAHRYRAPEDIADPVWPLADATWIDTEVLESPVNSDEQAWDIMAIRAGRPS